MAFASAAPAFAAGELVLIPDAELFGVFGLGDGLGMLWVMLAGIVALSVAVGMSVLRPAAGRSRLLGGDSGNAAEA